MPLTKTNRPKMGQGKKKPKSQRINIRRKKAESRKQNPLEKQMIKRSRKLFSLKPEVLARQAEKTFSGDLTSFSRYVGIKPRAGESFYTYVTDLSSSKKDIIIASIMLKEFPRSAFKKK